MVSFGEKSQIIERKLKANGEPCGIFGEKQNRQSPKKQCITPITQNLSSTAKQLKKSKNTFVGHFGSQTKLFRRQNSQYLERNRDS